MVTIITGVAAGGQADLAARPVAQGLSQVFDKSVIVDNRTGLVCNRRCVCAQE